MKFSHMKSLLMGLAAVAAAAFLSGCATISARPRTVVVWSEGTAEVGIYPVDINGAIVEGLKADPRFANDNIVRASLQQPDQGIPDELLNKADVLIWWGHKKHGLVSDELTAKIKQRWQDGKMGYIGLHSAHFAKPNKAILGTPCSFAAYKCDITKTEFTVTDKTHPIAAGLPEKFTIANGERYSDPYLVPEGYKSMFDGLSTLRDGTTENAKMGYAWDNLGKSRAFYLQAGHETDPIFCDPNIRTIIGNATEWVMPRPEQK